VDPLLSDDHEEFANRIPQWLRTASFSSVASFGRLLRNRPDITSRFFFA
jgi:hypothetical protein